MQMAGVATDLRASSVGHDPGNAWVEIHRWCRHNLRPQPF